MNIPILLMPNLLDPIRVAVLARGLVLCCFARVLSALASDEKLEK